MSLIALGSNLPSQTAGAPESTLRAALRMMHAEQNISIHDVSEFWLSAALPSGSGPDYCNAVASVVSDLHPQELLALLHDIEFRFGRSRENGLRWRSRPLDLDLLAVGDLILPDADTQDDWRILPAELQALRAPETLILPHPRLQDRGFVLAPLAQIAPDWRHPRTGRSVAEMLADLPRDLMDGLRPLGLTSAPARTTTPSPHP